RGAQDPTAVERVELARGDLAPRREQHRLVAGGARGHVQPHGPASPRRLAPRAAPTNGPEQLARGRVVHHPQHPAARFDQSDGHGELRPARDVGARPVQRVHDPYPLPSEPVRRVLRFLREPAVLRPCAEQPRAQDLVGLEVRRRERLVWLLVGDLVRSAEPAHERLARLTRGRNRQLQVSAWLHAHSLPPVRSTGLQKTDRPPAPAERAGRTERLTARPTWRRGARGALPHSHAFPAEPSAPCSVRLSTMLYVIPAGGIRARPVADPPARGLRPRRGRRPYPPSASTLRIAARNGNTMAASVTSPASPSPTPNRSSSPPPSGSPCSRAVRNACTGHASSPITTVRYTTAVIMNAKPPKPVGICAAFSVSKRGNSAPKPSASAATATVTPVMVI